MNPPEEPAYDAYVRFKDRPQPVLPSLTAPRSSDYTLSVKKKVGVPEANPYGEEGFVETIIAYLPAHTQTKRVEKIVKSDEEVIRRERHPTMEERQQMEKDWTKQKMREARREAEAQERKRRWEKKMLKEAGIYEDIKKAEQKAKIAESKAKGGIYDSTYTHTHTHSLSLSHTHTHTLSLSLSLSLYERRERGEGKEERGPIVEDLC